jgi:hypothetical protein
VEWNRITALLNPNMLRFASKVITAIVAVAIPKVFGEYSLAETDKKMNVKNAATKVLPIKKIEFL